MSQGQLYWNLSLNVVKFVSSHFLGKIFIVSMPLWRTAIRMSMWELHMKIVNKSSICHRSAWISRRSIVKSYYNFVVTELSCTFPRPLKWYQRIYFTEEKLPLKHVGCQWSEEASKDICSVPGHVSDGLKKQKGVINWSYSAKDLCTGS